MSDTLTLTDADVARVAAKIEAADILGDDDLTALAAVFLLAGRAVGDAHDVEGFMPTAVERSGAMQAFSLNFTKGQLGVGLLGTFNQGAKLAGGVVNHEEGY